MFLILSSQLPCEEVGRLFLSTPCRRGNRRKGPAGPGHRGRAQALCLHPLRAARAVTPVRVAAAFQPAGRFRSALSLWATGRLSRNNHNVPSSPRCSGGQWQAGARRVPRAGTDRCPSLERTPHHLPASASVWARRCPYRGAAAGWPWGRPAGSQCPTGKSVKDPHGSAPHHH